jgi:hypothetical protein
MLFTTLGFQERERGALLYLCGSYAPDHLLSKVYPYWLFCYYSQAVVLIGFDSYRKTYVPVRSYQISTLRLYSIHRSMTAQEYIGGLFLLLSSLRDSVWTRTMFKKSAPQR